MRFIPLNCIREEMILGKKLLGKHGELLLNEGSVIYDSYISKIREYGYNGIYINDELSKDIEVIDIIGDDLRHKTTKAIKDIFVNIGDGREITLEAQEALSDNINDILEKIMSEKSLVINMIDLKMFDSYTFSHSVNVCVLSIIIGAALNLPKDKLHQLGLASILHDIGKVFISKDILSKPDKLTDEEFEIMKSHPSKGYEYLNNNFQISLSARIGVLDHHKRYDGSGYPEDENSKSISLFGRIIAVSDVYDALTSDRTYRRALSPSEAIEFILGGSDSQFDPNIVKAFIRRIAPYPVGTLVKLSNDTQGIVIENNSEACLRPKVRIIKYAKDEITPYIIDLLRNSNTFNITITGIADEP